MAVYTQIDRAILESFVARYGIGALQSYRGIEAGVSNTNYFVDTDQGRYVLTLFEPHRVNPADIDFFTQYTNTLYEAGLPVPEVLCGEDGAQIYTVCGRPACLYRFLTGESIAAGELTPEACAQAGEMLALMHVAAARMTAFHPDPYGPNKWRHWIEAMGADIDATRAGLLDICREEYNAMAGFPCETLTSGPLHGDYFPDNVFFKDGALCGVIDFHFAGTGWFLYDLAIAVNAWCFDQDNKFVQACADAMMAAYRTVMPLEAHEYEAMPMMLRLAAMRFLLSRIEEKANWQAGTLGQPHDPVVFLERLEHFRT